MIEVDIKVENTFLKKDMKTYDELLLEFDKKVLPTMLKRHKGNQRQTAKALGINRGTLYKKLKKIGFKDGKFS